MLSVKICIGTSCYLKGAYNVLQYFQHEIEAKNLHDKIDITGSFCMGNCGHGVTLSINEKIYAVAPEDAPKFFKETIAPLIE